MALLEYFGCERRGRYQPSYVHPLILLALKLQRRDTFRELQVLVSSVKDYGRCKKIPDDPIKMRYSIYDRFQTLEKFKAYCQSKINRGDILIVLLLILNAYQQS